MAKNHSSSTEGEGVCERLYRAVNCGGSAFKSLRRGSPPPPRSSAAPEIPVVFNHGQDASAAATATAAAAKNPPAAKEKRVSLAVAEDHHHHHKPPPSEEKHGGYHHHHEAHFSDYITRVRARISRTLTHAGGGEGGGNERKAAVVRRDSFNDKVSNYIHRARNSIRATSNVGEGFDEIKTADVYDSSATFDGDGEARNMSLSCTNPKEKYI
nr:uncharacterized protein LOC109191223 [Ipomoea batatas]